MPPRLSRPGKSIPLPMKAAVKPRLPRVPAAKETESKKTAWPSLPRARRQANASRQRRPRHQAAAERTRAAAAKAAASRRQAAASPAAAASQTPRPRPRPARRPRVARQPSAARRRRRRSTDPFHRPLCRRARAPAEEPTLDRRAQAALPKPTRSWPMPGRPRPAAI